VDIADLGRLDLNLLVALEALMEERSVSRAAERLYITQSAMSKTLGRLRELFDDPLFIRKSTGMVPTPRAEQLALRLPQVLQSIQSMFEPVTFDPATYAGEFNLLVQGHMGIWLLPALTAYLSTRAPNVRLRVLSRTEQTFEKLHNGKLDFVLQAELHHYPEELQRTTIGYAPPMLLARKGHPLEGKEITWEAARQFPHVQLLVDELADIHFITGERSIFIQNVGKAVPNLRVDQLSTAIQVVRKSDYLFPAPPLLLEQGDISTELIALPLPEGEEVTLRYVMVSHPRIAGSLAHNFLRQRIIEVIEHFRARHNLPPLAELQEPK
jgi:DNA-binding transcriptional LysR family regulator